MKQSSFVLTNLREGQGGDETIRFIEREGMLSDAPV